jgi:hypothetical protein
LAPDCSKLELGEGLDLLTAEKLLYSMGWETGNIHLASGNPKVVLADLRRRPANWLVKATEVMTKATQDDWKQWSRGKSKAVR